MWLSAALLLTVVLTLTLLEVCIGPLWPTKYWKNTTAYLQHKPQTMPQNCCNCLTSTY